MSKKSGDEGKDAWVFDSLVGFLRGPVWNVPILTFIEHKSLIFEPDNDEHEEEYKKIHEEYKNLVDFMLGSYMEDIGITSGQFEAACNVASTRIKSQFHHALFEQVWAADDYEIFKRMMIQKNIELQLQALELLRQRYGVLPSSLQPEKKASKSKDRQSESEARVMEAVLKSQNEGQAAGGQDDQDDEDPDDVVFAAVKRKSLEEHQANKDKGDELGEEMAKSNTDQQRLEALRQNQQDILAEHFKSKVSISDPSVGEKAKTTPMKSSRPIKPLTRSMSRTSQRNLKELKGFPPPPPLVLGPAMSAPPPGANAEIDEAELKRRTEFLKAQRDKLLAMKKEERDKQLAEAEKQQMKSRPKSARAARSAFGKGGRASGAAGIDPQTLKVRRALAEKLKQEVVGKH